MNRHKLNTIVLGFLAIALSMHLTAQEVGDMSPDFTLKTTDDKDFTLSDHEGKVVFIFFFGNSCGHCLANGPNTQTDIYSKYMNNEDFVAVGIDTWDGNASAVEGYKASTKIEYDLLLNGSQVVKDYSSTYDRIILVDKEGKIQYKSTSNADKATTAAASAKIAELLEQTTSVGSQLKSKEFLLAPNKVGNELIINNPFENDQQVNVRIVSITGKTVLNQQLELSQANHLDINALPMGYYTLVLESASDIRIAKFVKAL